MNDGKYSFLVSKVCNCPVRHLYFETFILDAEISLVLYNFYRACKAPFNYFQNHFPLNIRVQINFPRHKG